MKTMLLLALSIITISAHSQKKLTTIDNLRGDTSYYTEKIYLYGKKGMTANYRASIAFQLLQRRGDLFLNISGAHEGQYITTLASGDSLFLRLKNGQIVGLPYINTSTTDYPICAGCNITYFTQTFLLDEQTISALSSAPVVFVRADSKARHFDYEVDENKQDMLIKSLALFK
jgi:hypothetical protein